MIWVTRARVNRSRRAIAACDATSPATSCLCHSRARARGCTRWFNLFRDSRRLRAVRAFARLITRQLEKFLFEELLGSPSRPKAELRVRARRARRAEPSRRSDRRLRKRRRPPLPTQPRFRGRRTCRCARRGEGIPSPSVDAAHHRRASEPGDPGRLRSAPTNRSRFPCPSERRTRCRVSRARTG